MLDQAFWIGLTEIIFVNILLSGDNAVVIALACRNLPKKQMRQGIVLGSAAAIILRILFTIFVAKLLDTPYLKIVGGMLLLWIAIKLMLEGEPDADDILGGVSIWAAVRTITVADAVMSLDNVLAIASAAKGHNLLMILGLLISMPLIIAGSALILKLLQRFPIVVLLGAGLLGWLAGEMIVTDTALVGWVGPHINVWFEIAASVAGAAFVVASGYGVRWHVRRKERLNGANQAPSDPH